MRHHPVPLLPSLLVLLAIGSAACDPPSSDESHPWRESDQSPPPGDEEPLPPMDISQLTGMSVIELQALPTVATVQYQMSPLPSAATFNHPTIARPFKGWPVHALQWKDYVSTPSFDINVAAAEVSSFGNFGYSVYAFDSDLLDDLEANSAVFASDPSGVWQEEIFTDPAEGLVFAALVMHYWGSPVYKGVQHSADPVATVITHSIALEMLEFDIPTAADLHAACGLSSNVAPAVALTTIPTCNHGAVLTANQVSLWNETPLSGSYIANTSIPPLALATAYSVFSGDPLVFDPPGEVTVEDIEALRVLATALADQVLIPDADGILVPLRGIDFGDVGSSEG